MAGEVADHFATAGGMPDMHGALAAQVVDHGRHVVGVVVHVVAVPHLAGAAMATAVMGDHPVAPCQEVEQLGIPVVGAERPAVVEVNGLGVPWPQSL
jgi:hypothetical protein